MLIIGFVEYWVYSQYYSANIMPTYKKNKNRHISVFLL